MQNDESVSGTIIGNVTRKVADRFFANDKQAVEWFMENYLNEYKHGVEMRCFDCIGNSL